VNRTLRCETLAQATSADVQRLAALVLDGALPDVQVVTPPTVGMLMARAVDGARSETFNLGEVLVAEARVSIAGHHGWAMVMGGDADHALAAAVVDAGLEANHPNASRITAALDQIAHQLQLSVAADLQSVAATRVRFANF
jgi:alpha-D-ribose 1-methylphosphonate 5-triphosphate synthase subunit PhnG